MVLNYGSNSINELSHEEFTQQSSQISDTYVNDGIPFNLNLTLKGFRADTLVRELIRRLHENNLCLRTQRLDTHLKVIIANLIKGESFHRTRYPFYSRSPNYYKYIKRYNPLHITYRPLISATNGLTKLGFTKNYIGFFDRDKTKRGKQTRIVIEHPLFDLLKTYRIDINDIISLPSEIIRLKDDRKILIDYEDTDEIIKSRKRLVKHNTLLKRSDIAIEKSSELNEYLSIEQNDAVDFTQ